MLVYDHFLNRSRGNTLSVALELENGFIIADFES